MQSKDRIYALGFTGIFFLCALSQAQSSNNITEEDLWRAGATIPINGRTNPYQLNDIDLKESIRRGKLYAQNYPVEVTGLLAPRYPIQKFIEGQDNHPLLQAFRPIFKGITHFKKFNDLFSWIGLHDYPQASDSGIYSMPYPQDVKPRYKVGYSPIIAGGAEGFTISCAACHSAQLFGKTVLGMTNRFPRANEIFVRVKKITPFISGHSLIYYGGATANEAQMYENFKSSLSTSGAKLPLVLGLDTSLAQVALSLARRNPDPWASRNHLFEHRPRQDDLDTQPGDSKPAVWWNTKYKDRWLSDGSVVSGNPIFTNILWNEIGRGTDLRTLDQWLWQNTNKMRDLANAVLSIEAPRITDFFPVERIEIARARRGQKIFQKSCAGCHGIYEKNWDLPHAETMSPVERLKNARVLYKTKVVDVGTDPYRRKMMKSLEKLNEIEISKRFNTVIQTQKGYVPPPLVGIWARWPYMHNNSIPSLCALLTPAAQRPKFYYAGAALNPQTDFDFNCNGYPLGSRAPIAWREKQYLYDTSRVGMSQLGHEKNYEGIGPQERQDLIQFLQTL